MPTLKQRIYLASSSPRRRELLRQIGVDFTLLLLRNAGTRGVDVNEDVIPGESPEQYVARITREKAAFGQHLLLTRQLPIMPILAADTTVTIDGEILGKPVDAAEAAATLRKLSERTHQVLTSVAVQHNKQVWQTTQISDVTFAPLDDQMIERYCITREPYDKAGGYGIQGMAAIFIKHISGSYSGIMGLPLHETAQLLKKAGIQTL